MHKDRARAYRSSIKKCSSKVKKVFWGAKVFTQCCVIKKEPTKSVNGCSFKCLRREGMFFPCQLAFDTGQKGGDLALPSAVMGQVFPTAC